MKSVEQRFATTMEALISGHTRDASTVLSLRLVAVEVKPHVFVKKKRNTENKLIHKFVKSSDLKFIS